MTFSDPVREPFRKQCFLNFPKQIANFQIHLYCCLQMLSNWTSLKLFCRVGKSQAKLSSGTDKSIIR